MNAFINTFNRTALRTISRRFASTVSSAGNSVPPKIKYNFRKEWLSDPSTYPLMLIMGGAMTFMIGMTANATFFYKGVYFDPRKRNSQMVTWGDTENHSVVERAVHWCSWQKNAPEGLGVNHNEWKKQKEEYFKEMENNEILE